MTTSDSRAKAFAKELGAADAFLGIPVRAGADVKRALEALDRAYLQLTSEKGVLAALNAYTKAYRRRAHGKPDAPISPIVPAGGGLLCRVCTIPVLRDPASSEAWVVLAHLTSKTHRVKAYLRQIKLATAKAAAERNSFNRQAAS